MKDINKDTLTYVDKLISFHKIILNPVANTSLIFPVRPIQNVPSLIYLVERNKANYLANINRLIIVIVITIYQKVDEST